jgi:small subunit ribosomal protein S21
MKMQNIYLEVDDRGVERTLRKFKRMCDSYGIVKKYRAKQEYKKPSIQAKEKSEAAEKRRRKTQIKTYRSRTKI